MKKTKLKSISTLSSESFSVNIALMVIFILLGIFSGCVCCFSTNFQFDYQKTFENFSSSDEQIVFYSFGRSCFYFIKYPFILFLLSFTAFGFFLIPIIVFFKGFFLSFSVASIFKYIETNALYIAFAMFGFQTLFSIPCIIVFASISFDFSKKIVSLFKTKTTVANFKGIHLRKYFLAFLFLIVFVLFFAFLDTLITPKLIANATKATIIKG